jgi:DNA polymerase sigma
LSRNYHNWNHIHKGLQELGFLQISTYNTIHSELLYYKKGNKEIMIEKSNKIDRLVVEKICDNIGISYDDFVESYKKAYSRI